MMAPKKWDHWYEWLGDFTRDAMKGWGISTVIILSVLAVFVYLGVQKGGPYIDAQTAKMLAEAQAARTVSEAVTKLTALTERNQEAMERVRLEHQEFASAFTEAKQMMQGAPARGEKTNALLQDLIDEIRETRKNGQAAPTTRDGGA